MSLENAKRFIEVASQDQAFKEKLAAAQEPAEALRLAVEAGSERGLPFTSEELVAGIRRENIPNANSEELSPSELNQVAGGIGFLFAAFGAGTAVGAWGAALTQPEVREGLKDAGTALTKSIDVGKLIP